MFCRKAYDYFVSMVYVNLQCCILREIVVTHMIINILNIDEVILKWKKKTITE